MKKFLKSVFFSGLLCSASALQALPVGNPAEPSLLIDGVMFEGLQGDPCDPCISFCDSISLRAGFYGDYVFDRSLKTDVNKLFTMGKAFSGAAKDLTIADVPEDSVSNVAYGQHLHNAELYTNAAFLALNIWDRFDIFCTLGAMNGYIKGNSKAFNLVGVIGDIDDLANTQKENVSPNCQLNQAVVELYTDTAFAWSIGARAALWECGCASLGAEFQYAQSKPKVETLNVLCNVAEFTINKPKGYVNQAFPLPQDAGTDAATSGLKSASIDYHEWQLGLALSYRFNMMVPYVGLKFARASLDADSIRIAQPELAHDASILGSTTWNPTILGVQAADPQLATNAGAYQVQDASLQINKMKSRKSCGLVLGTTLVDADKMAVTGEVRLIDERAAHVNAQFRF